MPVNLPEVVRRLERVEPLAEQVPVLRAILEEIRAAVNDLREEQKSLRRALYTAAISVAGSSVIFIIGISRLFG